MNDNENMARRKFLTMVSGAGLSGVALLTGDAFAATASGADLGTLKHNVFTPLVGATFQIQTADGKTSVAVDLVSVTPLPRATRARARRPAFSLLFRGPLASPLPQDCYTIKQAAVTLNGVFVAYVGPDKGKKNSYYEAIFN